MPKRNTDKIQHSASPSNGDAVIYLRVATSQPQEDALSLSGQSELLNKYAHSNALRVAAEFVDIENVNSLGRSSFTQMVTFLEKNPSVKHILVEEMGNLYRNLTNYALIVDLGCAIHILRESTVVYLDSDSPEAFQHRIKIVLAKIFINELSKFARKGMTERAKEGFWPSRAPLGYLNAILPSGKKGIVQDEKRAKLVGQLFQKYATGNFSLKQLTQWATLAGLTFRRSGDPVNKATINGILHHLIYTGDFEFDGKLYKGNHEPIISRELWDKVQSVLDRKCSYHYRVSKHDLPFSGVIRCGHCGCAVIGEIKKGKYVYYHCTGQRG